MKTICLFSLILSLTLCNNKGTHPVNTSHSAKNNKAMFEIVIYLQPGINLEILDNRFVANGDNKDRIDELNKVLEKFEAKVKKLGGKSEIDSTRKIYYILTEKQPEPLVESLSRQTDLIESAYVKPASEDPGGF